MPKRLPPNNRPWPENMAFDLSLSPTITAGEAETFISSLPTSDRNKEFLRLRYKEGKTYNEIADEYGLTSTGVRLAVKTMWEKFGGSAAPTATPTVTDLALTTMMPTPTAPVPPTPPVAIVVAPVKDESTTARPLSINLAAVRRFLGLSTEEFARPISIEDGEALIARLETGFSKASQPVLDLICDAWGINRSYLLTGIGEMFEDSSSYCSSLVCLLKRYLQVATFDRQGQQYWKGSLVDDLGRIIDVQKLSGREMCRVIRVLYDYIDVDAFEALLDRMGRAI